MVSFGRQLVHNVVLCFGRISSSLQGEQHAPPFREREKD